MATTYKIDYNTAYYTRLKRYGFSSIPVQSTYMSSMYEAEGITSTPVDGAYIKPTRYTGTGKRAIVPAVKQLTYDRWIPTMGSPACVNESIWDHRSLSNAQLRAISQVADKKMNLGETLAESPQTFRMIGSNAAAIYQMFRALRRGDMRAAGRAVGISKNFRNWPKDLSNRYLELIFGWKPLIDEVYNGIDVLQNGLGRENVNAYITTKARESVVLTRSYSSTTTLPSGTCTSDFRGHVSYTYRYRFPWRFRTMNQLGIANIPSLAWQLLPYSFLIDWFFPVGNYLDCFTATEGCSFEDAYHTNFVKHLYKGDASTTWPDGCVHEYTLLQRRIITTSNPPLPQFDLPNLGIGQAASIVALLVQRTSH